MSEGAKNKVGLREIILKLRAAYLGTPCIMLCTFENVANVHKKWHTGV